ncbi:hypothetical protein B0H12DRAFT_1240175 [Mycena haematopus]|nr:hypothetical protein B0H12DRAFT_1240175 [Mycena haematopus]
MSVSVASAAQIAALLSNWSSVTKSIYEYRTDDATSQRLADEANKGREAIHEIQKAFDRVSSIATLVDDKKYRGPDGKVIQKFGPTWQGYSEAYEGTLSQIETLAANGKGTIDAFTKRILRILQSATVAVAPKEKRISLYVTMIDQNDQNIKAIGALIDVYQGILNGISQFKATFEEKMERCGARRSSEVQGALADIATIGAKLEQLRVNAKMLAYAGYVTDGFLNTSKDADEVDLDEIRNTEIERAAASYANLATILDAFA